MSIWGAVPKPVEQLVDVAKVKLIHPFSRPHETRDDRLDAHALNLHYARVGVDPRSAHNGDPLPMGQQPKLQQATRAPDGSEIPLGISGIYRGYDDGFFYAANEGTAESAATQALRRKLAEQKATAQGDAAAMVANDNDPEIDEAVARSYGKQAPITSAVKPAAAVNTLSQQSAAVADRLPQLISAIEKLQKGESLSADDSDLLARTDAAFAKAGVPIDLKKVDVKRLKQTVGRAANPSDSVDNLNASAIESTSPAIAGATLAIPAGGASLTGLRTAAATVGALLEEAAVGTAALGAAAFTGLVGLFLALMTSSTQGPEADEVSGLYQQSTVQPKPADIDREKVETIQEMPSTETAARPSNSTEQISNAHPLAAPKAFNPNSEATQASTTGAQPDSSLRKLLLENNQTYISLVAKLRRGEMLTEQEVKLSKEIISTIDQDTKEIAPTDVKLGVVNVATAEQPHIPEQIINDGVAIIPSIKNWLLNLLRGNPDEGAKPDCNEVFKHCQGLCIDMVVNEPHNLPGEGSDKSGRYVRCVRECMEAHGCFDY